MQTKVISLVLLLLLSVLTLGDDSAKKDNSNKNNNPNNKPSSTTVEGETENDGENEKFFGIDKSQYKEQREWIKQVMDNKEVMFVQQVCMTYGERDCSAFHYENLLVNPEGAEKAEQLNQMAKQLKHMDQHLSFKPVEGIESKGKGDVGIYSDIEISDKDVFLFTCDDWNCLTNEHQPKSFYNYKDIKQNFEEYSKVLSKLSQYREIQLALNLLVHLENINNSVFSLYLPLISVKMNTPLYSFGLSELQVLQSIDSALVRGMMDQRLKITEWWNEFKNVTSNYTAKESQSIFGLKEERHLDFTDFAWAIMHVMKYGKLYEAKYYLIPGIEYIKEVNNYQLNYEYITQTRGSVCLWTKTLHKGRLHRYYSRDAISYFVLEWEIKRNHPTECLNVQLINPKQIGQCLEDLLQYIRIQDGTICVRREKAFYSQLEIFVGLATLKRSFSCKCRDEVRDEVNSKDFNNARDVSKIIVKRCLDNDKSKKGYKTEDLRPKFQELIDAKRLQITSVLGKLNDQEFVLDNLQGIYFENLDLLYQLLQYKKSLLTILERGLKRAYAASDQEQFKWSEKNVKQQQKEDETNKNDPENPTTLHFKEEL